MHDEHLWEYILWKQQVQIKRNQIQRWNSLFICLWIRVRETVRWLDEEATIGYSNEGER